MMHTELKSIITNINLHTGLWKDAQITTDVKMFLWEKYDPDEDSLLYRSIDHWDDLLSRTIISDAYNALTKDEVLSILFGLIHRTRIIDGLWWSMFDCGVVQRLLKRLLVVD